MRLQLACAFNWSIKLFGLSLAFSLLVRAEDHKLAKPKERLLTTAKLSTVGPLVHNSGKAAQKTGTQDLPEDHDHPAHDHFDQEAKLQKTQDGTFVIKVNGMVCAFCAQGIQKNFKARAEVDEAKVSLETMEVTVTTKKGKSLSTEVIKKIVTDAGFQFVELKK